MTEGQIYIGDALVNQVRARQRDVAMVFQNYALYPHMSVAENLAFGLQMRRVDPATIAKRVETVARSLNIDHLLERKPKQLSGGQQQRVALGRAIAREPKVFLPKSCGGNAPPIPVHVRGRCAVPLTSSFVLSRSFCDKIKLC